MSGYRTFVVPYDFSSHARAALYVAADLARRLGADLHLVHVIQHPYAHGGLYGTAPPPVDMAQLRESLVRSLRDVADGVTDLPRGPEEHIFEGTGIANTIQEAAEKLGADLIVMGTHGHTGLARVFLGSVAERTLRSAPCPVLTVQAPEAEEAADGAPGGPGA